jgi:hypothetical protein
MPVPRLAAGLWELPLLSGIYEITAQFHGKLIVADLVNSFSAFIGHKCTYIIVIAIADYWTLS